MLDTNHAKMGFAPVERNVTVNTGWCTLSAMSSHVISNKAEYCWAGPYNNNDAFTAVYQVTVPVGTAPGTYNFADGNL